MLYNINFFILNLLFISNKCQILSLRLQNFYQISLFISSDCENFTNSKMYYTLSNNPIKIYSFNNYTDQIQHHEISQKSSENMYFTQESMIIFYTNNLNETTLFIDNLIPQLSIKKRPKCLIISLSTYNSNYEISVNYFLRYAWEKKFLDFSVVINSSSLIYYLNPFSDIVYKEELNENVELFPEKLHNAYGYPLYTVN